jgi:hypothetical protein
MLLSQVMLRAGTKGGAGYSSHFGPRWWNPFSLGSKVEPKTKGACRSLALYEWITVNICEQGLCMLERIGWGGKRIWSKGAICFVRISGICCRTRYSEQGIGLSLCLIAKFFLCVDFDACVRHITMSTNVLLLSFLLHNSLRFMGFLTLSASTVRMCRPHRLWKGSYHTLSLHRFFRASKVIYINTYAKNVHCFLRISDD